MNISLIVSNINMARGCRICDSYGKDLIETKDGKSFCKLCKSIYNYQDYNETYIDINTRNYYRKIANINYNIKYKNISNQNKLTSKLCWDKYSLNIPDTIDQIIYEYLGIGNIYSIYTIPIQVNLINVDRFFEMPMDNYGIAIKLQRLELTGILKIRQKNRGCLNRVLTNRLNYITNGL